MLLLTVSVPTLRFLMNVECLIANEYLATNSRMINECYSHQYSWIRGMIRIMSCPSILLPTRLPSSWQFRLNIISI